MIASSLVLLAVLSHGAGQQPLPPPSPSWPAGVTAKARAEVPYLVAAVSLPVDQPPTLLPLVAAWLEQPESWPEGPVKTLLAAGGRLSATAFADGLVIVTEGPSARQGEVIAAALAVLESRPAEGGFEAARAEALSAALDDDEGVRSRRALWRAWYGKGAAARRGPLGEEAFLQATPAAALAALDDMKARSFGHRLFLEGDVQPDALPRAVASLRPTWAPTGPPSLPRPAAPATIGAEGMSSPEGAMVVVGHPLPRGPWSDVVGRAYVRALQRRLAPLGEATVAIEPGRHASLLVVTLRPAAGTAEEARTAVAKALEEARAQATTDRALTQDLEAAAAELAKAERRLGAWAAHRARVHLTGPAALPTEEDQRDALVGLLRITVLPEILRAAPPPPAGAAPSVASGTGPG